MLNQVKIFFIEVSPLNNIYHQMMTLTFVSMDLHDSHMKIMNLVDDFLRFQLVIFGDGLSSPVKLLQHL